MELRKFSGQIKEWLSFWSTFKRIHEDASILNDETFHYLLQSIVEIRAYYILNSFQLLKIIPKAIRSSENRFGKKWFISRPLYVRELLKLVSIKRVKQPTRTAIYDQLETHLPAPESLTVTTDMWAVMLVPLDESSLREEVLRTWQKSTSQTTPSQVSGAESVSANTAKYRLM